MSNDEQAQRLGRWLHETFREITSRVGTDPWEDIPDLRQAEYVAVAARLLADPTSPLVTGPEPTIVYATDIDAGEE